MKKYIIGSLIILSLISIYITISVANAKTELAEKKRVYITLVKEQEIKKLKVIIKNEKVKKEKAVSLTYECLEIADNLNKIYE